MSFTMPNVNALSVNVKGKQMVYLIILCKDKESGI